MPAQRQFSLSDCPCRGKTLERLLRPALLIALAGESRYGYRLIAHLSEMPFLFRQQPNKAGVYRCLKVMEIEGLIASSWEPSAAGPAKRCYAISAKGRACLASWLETLHEYRHAIDHLLTSGRDALAERPEETCCCK